MKINPVLPTNTRQFIRDYRLPIFATLAFVVIVAFLFIGRLRENVTLGQIFAARSSGGDYANLLSNDKHDDFVKRDVSADDQSIQGQNARQSTVTTAPTGTTANSSVPGATTPSPTIPSSPAGPFAAGITDFRQDQSPALECPNGLLSGINTNKCSKVYSFAAGVQTSNGPGTVKYEWRYSVSGSSNGSFVAASGTNVTTLHNQLTLSCKDPGVFTAQFALTNPGATQSGTMQINHSC